MLQYQILKSQETVSKICPSYMSQYRLGDQQEQEQKGVSSPACPAQST